MLSCQNSDSNTDAVSTENTIEELVSKADIKALQYTNFMVDKKVEKTITNWEKYRELNLVITDVKGGNLSFFKSNNDVLATLNMELKTTIPDAINSPFVMARVIAVETKMYKLESEVNLSNPSKERILESVKELVTAFSNLNLQMNKQIEKESQRIQKPS